MIEICHTTHLWTFEEAKIGNLNTNFRGLHFNTKIKPMKRSKNLKFAHNVMDGKRNIMGAKILNFNNNCKLKNITPF